MGQVSLAPALSLVFFSLSLSLSIRVEPPGVMDVHAFGSRTSAPKCLLSGPKTYSLGCFFVLDLLFCSDTSQGNIE